MWYRRVFSASNLFGRTFFALCVYSAGLSAAFAADSFKVGEATYTVVIQQPSIPLEKLAISGTTPQKIIGFDADNKPYALEALIGTLVLTPLKEFAPAATAKPEGIIENTAVSYGQHEIDYAYFAEVADGVFSPILGKLPVGKTLVAVLKNGTTLKFSLPEGYIFENTTPVVIDLNKDGLEEILATETNLQTATSVLGLYIPVTGRLKRMASSPALPQGHWVDALGALDWQSDGKPAILALEAPNINGFLQFYAMKDGKMESVRREYGYSSRVVGTSFSQTVVLADMNDDGTKELVMPRNSMDAVAVLNFEKGLMSRLYEVSLPASIRSAFFTAHTEKGAVRSIAFMLADGQVVLMTRVQKEQ